MLDTAPVAGRGAQAWRHARPELDRAREGDRGQARDDPGAGLGHGERRDLQAERARLEPRQLEEVSDEVAHRADDVTAPLEEVSLVDGVLHLPAEDELEIAGQAGQRRAHLVGDVGNEPGVRSSSRARSTESSRSVATWSVTSASATAAWRAR